MAARAWFTEQNTQGLYTSELRTLNHAVRLWLTAEGLEQPNRTHLMQFRQIFDPELSPADLVVKYDNEFGGEGYK